MSKNHLRNLLKCRVSGPPLRDTESAVGLQNLHFKKEPKWGFPDGTVVKSLPANAGDMGSSPGLGRSHMPRRN